MTDEPRAVSPTARIINVLAIIAGIVGLGIGLYALAGPLGVWFGLADFGAGFDKLRTVNAWADWIAIGALLVTFAALAGATLLKLGNSTRLASLALAGTVAAALAYYIPESFRPAPGTPPIHDISTDTIDPPQYVAIAPIRADAANSMDYGSGRDMTPERLRQLQQEAYPDIVPQRFSESQDVIFERALAAVDQLGWELVAAVPGEGRIEATDTTFWFRFKDDVVIKINRVGGETVLNARSLSRVGVGDVGKNAARLREFFALL